MSKSENKSKVSEVIQPLVSAGNYLEAARQIARVVGNEELEWRMTYDVINDAKEDMLEIFRIADDSAEAFQALEAAYFLDAGQIGSPANQKIIQQLATLSPGLINREAYPLLDELHHGYKAFLAGNKFSYKQGDNLRFVTNEKALYEAVAKDYGVALAGHERD